MACSRKAAVKVRDAEVRGALLTFSELQVHMADRGRLFPPDSVDLDAFLFDGTESQLRWLVKAGQLDHDLSAYDFRGQPQREARQAAVAEPPMLAFLERQIEQLYNSQEPAVESDVGPLGVWLWCAAAGSPWQVQSAPVLSFYIPLPLWPREAERGPPRL